MKRKYSFWLSILPDDVKEKWLENFGGTQKFFDREGYFVDFIIHSFDWGSGFYWSDIAQYSEDKIKQLIRNKHLRDLGI